jgi:hypothetical protein
MKKISWTDRVKNEEELCMGTVKEIRGMVHKRNTRKAKWVIQILRKS